MIAEDSVLLREGITRMLAEYDAEVDVPMPPTFTDEGLRAAVERRSVRPGTPVLVLSQYVEESFATERLGGSTVGVVYLLNKRVRRCRVVHQRLPTRRRCRHRARPRRRCSTADPQPTS